MSIVNVNKKILTSLLVVGLYTTTALTSIGVYAAEKNISTAEISHKFDTKGNTVTTLSASSFASPPMSDRPWVRWNFLPESSKIDVLEQELDEMFEAGIGGVEVGQGGVPTFDQLIAILKKANKLGIKVSVKYPPGAPVPGTCSADNDYVRKMLSVTDSFLTAGQKFDEVLSGEGTIEAVLAYRVVGNPSEDTKEIIELDRAHTIDLTSKITKTNSEGFFGKTTTAHLNWVAPTNIPDSTWVIITFRSVAHSPQPEVYSKQGTDELIAGYESYWTEEIKNLFTENGGDIFVDSHDADPWGAVLDMWSSNFVADFKAKVGYELIPNLAGLIHPTMNRIARRSVGFKTDHYYTFNDGSAERNQTDFNQFRTELFIENRITPFTNWAKKYGLTLRLQYEDGIMKPESAYNFGNQIEIAYHLDRVEHETLAQVDTIDSYRPMASANHMSGSTWYSNELAAALWQNNIQTLQDLSIRMSKGFAGGNTKPVYHVYPHKFAPDASWPGYDHFGASGFSGGWGPRNPNWASDAKALNNWMARNGQVLTQGNGRADIAVYMHNYSYPSTLGDIIGHWNDVEMYRTGYTWDYLDPFLLNLPQSKVADNVLAAKGPAYKALVFNGNLWPSKNTASGDLTLEMAERFLGFAKDGLPIIFTGPLPSEGPGYKPENDEKIRAKVQELLALDNVVHVNSESDVPEALTKMGINPAAKPDTPSTLFSVRRHDTSSDTDYYYLYNQGNQGNWYPMVYEEPTTAHKTSAHPEYFAGVGEAVDLQVTFEGEGYPYLLNTDTGEITPIAQYTRDENKLTLRVQLNRDETQIIAITPNKDKFGLMLADVHVENTSAGEAVQTSKGNIDIRTFNSGTFKTELSNGKTVNNIVKSIPGPMDLTNNVWQLVAQDWQPTFEYGTTGQDGARTTKHEIVLELDGLKSWPDIAELEKASGVGTYTTSLLLSNDWDKSYGGYLSLGQVVDSFTLEINGHAVGVSQIDPNVDIGSYLKAGENQIVVRVSTTLNNRLTTLNKKVAKRGVIQAYGLTGPVVFTPYRQVEVWKK